MDVSEQECPEMPDAHLEATRTYYDGMGAASV